MALAVAAIVLVPLVLWLIWELRDAPPGLDCGDESDAMQDRLVDDYRTWLVPAFVLGEAILLGVAWVVSRWRSFTPGERAGRPTQIGIALMGIYMLVCVVYHDAFAIWVLALVLLAYVWFVTVPLLLLIMLWNVLHVERRAWPPVLQLLVWFDILAVVPAILTLIVLRGTAPFFC